MPEKPDDDPFHDCELDPDAVLGTRTFHDVLFTEDTETPVNVLTGETPAHSQATVEEAKKFAASIDTETPQIALPASVETQVETQSKPYTSAAHGDGCRSRVRCTGRSSGRRTHRPGGRRVGRGPRRA